METTALRQAENESPDKVLEAMIEAAVKIEYPPQAANREADLIMGQMERNLAASGLELDTYLGMLGKTREGYRQELLPAAEERLQKRLVLEEVARLEALEADAEAVDDEIERLIEAMGPEAEQMRELLESPGGRQSVADDLVMAQTRDRVVQIGKGEAPELEQEAEAAGAEAEAELAEAEAAAAEEAGAEVEPLDEEDAGAGDEAVTDEQAPAVEAEAAEEPDAAEADSEAAD